MIAQVYDILNAGPRNRFMVSGRIVHNCTGDGPQPTNFPKAGPNVWLCKCGRHYGESRPACPWCGAGPDARVDHKGLPATGPSEWSPEAMNDAIEVMRAGDLDLLELFFGEALLTIAGCLRGTFIAAPGHDLISSDWTAIEAVVLACLAGEQWRVDLFRQGGKIYEASGAKVGGVPYEDLLEHKKRTGQHHPLRQVGKTCFTADTRVLTDSGIKAIVDVLSTDRVWDGEQWVTHSGVLDQGVRQVTNLDGARMTPDHKINTGLSWREARELVSSERIRCQAYSHGLAHSPSSGLTSGTKAALKRWLSLATVGRPPTESTSQTFSRGDQNSAMRALGSRPRLPGKTTGSTPTSFRTRNTGVAYSIGLPRQSGGAIAQPTKRGQTTAVGASRSATSGVSRLKAGAGSYATSSRFRGGTTPPSTLTASTRMGTTRRVISVSSRGKRTRGTSGKFKNSRGKSTSYERVYDLVNAGPRRRFTILTDVGLLIVSNCELALGYGGWVGSWRAFDPTDALTDDDVKKIILAWRKSSPEIVEFWGGQTRKRGYDLVEEYFGVEGMFVQAILNPGVEFDCRGLKFQMEGDCLYLTLLSGRRLAYHTPRLHPSDRYGSRYSISYWGWNTNPKNGPRGWIQIRTHGGKLVENVCQAVSNDLLRFASVNLERAGYPIVLHVYDEIVTEVPAGRGSVEELEAWMRHVPEWARGWPVGAAGGWRADRYRKG